MQLFSKLESSLGLTRGDVTVALFLICTALAGLIYTTFFDLPGGRGERRELLELRMRHDSILEAHRNARLAELDRAKPPAGTAAASHGDAADSLSSWEPVSSHEGAREDAAERAARPAASGGKKEALSGPVNLNTASRDALMRLPGVGEKTAEAIIERRNHVPFRRVEDIMEVKGIGEKKFEKMKQFIVVR